MPTVVQDVTRRVREIEADFETELVRRRDVVVIDRHRLGCFNALEKINCACYGRVNGVVAYVREVASRTEAYWCPIKHARRWPGQPPRHGEFTDHGAEVDHVARWREACAQVRRGG